MTGALTGRGRPAAAPRGRSSAGFSSLELLVALAVAALVLALAVPLAAHEVDASAARGAAHLLAEQFRAARQSAILTGASTAVVFAQSNDAWAFQRCVDGNGNGVRRTEITAGLDACPDAPITVDRAVPGAMIAIDPAIPGPDGDPGTADPVKFGSSDMASFSPAGSSTAGTVFVRSAEGQYAVRVGNMTGRTRVLRFDPARRTWGPG